MSSLPMEVDFCAEPPLLAPSDSSLPLTYWRPSGWSDFPTDFFESITVFLSLDELSSSFHPVCRGWRDGLREVAPRQDGITISSERLAKLGDAPVDIRRHVKMLCTTDVLAYALEPLAPTRLLPRLTHLICRIDCRGDDAETEGPRRKQRRIQFSSQLTRLTLTLLMALGDDAIPRWIQLERVLHDVTRVLTLTKLEVAIKVGVNESLESVLIPLRTMQPLARLMGSLTHLAIWCPENSEVTTASLTRGHVDLICSLYRLRYISLYGVANWSAAALGWIAAEPMMTHLRQMDLRTATISAAHAAVLARFTWMDYIRVCLGDPTFLASLTQLISASLRCRSSVDPVLLVSALTRCTRIAILNLTHPGITSIHLCALVSSLPQLGDLTLKYMDSLTSLSFASSVGHLAHTLESLTIFRCTALAPGEVRHLRGLTALRKLSLIKSFEAPLDDGTIARMTPTSQAFDRDAWPHLRTFEYTPPMHP